MQDIEDEARKLPLNKTENITAHSLLQALTVSDCFLSFCLLFIYFIFWRWVGCFSFLSHLYYQSSYFVLIKILFSDELIFL